MTFCPSQATGGGAKNDYAVARLIHVTHTPHLFGLGGDSIAVGWMDGGDYNFPFAFFKKNVGIKRHLILYYKTRTCTKPPHTFGTTINTESTTTEPPPLPRARAVVMEGGVG